MSQADYLNSVSALIPAQDAGDAAFNHAYAGWEDDYNMSYTTTLQEMESASKSQIEVLNSTFDQAKKLRPPDELQDAHDAMLTAFEAGLGFATMANNAANKGEDGSSLTTDEQAARDKSISAWQSVRRAFITADEQPGLNLPTPVQSYFELEGGWLATVGTGSGDTGSFYVYFSSLSDVDISTPDGESGAGHYTLSGSVVHITVPGGDGEVVGRLDGDTLTLTLPLDVGQQQVAFTYQQ